MSTPDKLTILETNTYRVVEYRFAAGARYRLERRDDKVPKYLDYMAFIDQLGTAINGVERNK